MPKVHPCLGESLTPHNWRSSSQQDRKWKVSKIRLLWVIVCLQFLTTKLITQIAYQLQQVIYRLKHSGRSNQKQKSKPNLKRRLTLWVQWKIYTNKKNIWIFNRKTTFSITQAVIWKELRKSDKRLKKAKVCLIHCYSQFSKSLIILATEATNSSHCRPCLLID